MVAGANCIQAPGSVPSNLRYNIPESLLSLQNRDSCSAGYSDSAGGCCGSIRESQTAAGIAGLVGASCEVVECLAGG